MWQDIMTVAFGGMGGVDAEEMMTLRERGARTRYFPLMLTPWGARVLRSRLARFLDNQERLLRGIRTVSGCRVIVDASKYATYGRLLEMVPSVELFVVHLVRDPRAVAYSWSRKKIQPDRYRLVHIRRYGPVGSSARWLVQNVAAEAFWRRNADRYMMLRYEDFVRRPRVTIERVLDLVGESPQDQPFETRNRVNLDPNHGVWGNPSRFSRGASEIRLDEQWKDKLRSWDRWIVSLATWPLPRRYEYDFRS